jgi:tetratricopeptide (TPR) repeat protein
MMRIWVLGVFAILVAVSCTKVPSADNETTVINNTDSLALAKNKDIQNFWTLYRQATKNRFAGLWQEAIDGYTMALKINNQHKDAIYYLANMHLELSEYQKAEETWYKLLQVNPLSSRAHYQLGKLYLNKDAIKFFDLDKATIKFQKTAEINRDFLAPVLHLGQISLIKGNYKDSREQLKIILGSDYKNVEAFFLLGYIDFRQGDMEKAMTNFNKAREYSVKQAPIKGVKGEGDTKTGESLERGVSQSIFFDYYKNLSTDKNVEIEAEMKLHYTKMNNFIVQLKKL